MLPTNPYLFIPTPDDVANLRRYQAVPTEKKLAWLEQMRALQIELLTRNPELRRQQERLRAGCRPIAPR